MFPGSPEPIALDTREAARRLGISPSMLEKLRCYSPEIGPPFFRIGRAVRYQVAALDAWSASKAQGGDQ